MQDARSLKEDRLVLENQVLEGWHPRVRWRPDRTSAMPGPCVQRRAVLSGCHLG